MHMPTYYQYSCPGCLLYTCLYTYWSYDNLRTRGRYGRVLEAISSPSICLESFVVAPLAGVQTENLLLSDNRSLRGTRPVAVFVLRNNEGWIRSPYPALDLHYRIRLSYLPILNSVVPQTGHTPLVAGLPFFITTSCGFLISLFVLHFMQYASIVFPPN